VTDGRMTARVRRVGVRSAFLLFLVIFGLVGALVGTGMATLSSLELGPETARTFLDRLGWWAPPLFFLGYGLLGGLAAAISAVLYNVAAAVTGGVRVRLHTAHEVEVIPYHQRERVETGAGEPGAEGGTGAPGDGSENGAGGRKSSAGEGAAEGGSGAETGPEPVGDDAGSGDRR